jgi:hypothetical protein
VTCICSALCAEFIASHVLFDASLAAQHAHPAVPDAYGPEFEPALKAVTLQRFVGLVYLLDQVGHTDRGELDVWGQSGLWRG